LTTLAPEPTTSGADHDDDLSHAACPCDEDIALCGADVAGVPWADDDTEPTSLCVVCVDLVVQPCQKCGD